VQQKYSLTALCSESIYCGVVEGMRWKAVSYYTSR